MGIFPLQGLQGRVDSSSVCDLDCGVMWPTIVTRDRESERDRAKEKKSERERERERERENRGENGNKLKK